ncbi:hypothetical protein D1B31_05875 [Neobacillus notoginsengisoli]|uniref:ABM domain-containing protein n=1 Tax=Neobacillus notoginsengisoli TaxID=1578198 RepID=A0A417YXP8_9BACI|nr:hypothetical protein [Neobacillus notoginsengisoli]RHW42162.1 hypothetical protein D1B31_05875 [Neobacillus notoginsengisoli]
MTVYVYQTFDIKQEKFVEAFKSLEKIVQYRNENYSHHIKLLSPIVGPDYTYVLLSEYEGLAEMEIQNKKMFDDEEYKEIFTPFFLEMMVQGSMSTSMFRKVKRNSGKPVEKEGKEKD